MQKKRGLAYRSPVSANRKEVALFSVAVRPNESQEARLTFNDLAMKKKRRKTSKYSVDDW